MVNLAAVAMKSEMELLDLRSKKRAAQVIRCLPFNTRFYSDAQQIGLNAQRVWQETPEYRLTGVSWFQHADAIEAAFRWLITVGVLRREVDGQGLTARIRLTPLGRQLLEQSPELPTQPAGTLERLQHFLRRLWPIR
ncbi:MAG: Npun_F0494 family protein [Prochlorococcus sp.]